MQGGAGPGSCPAPEAPCGLCPGHLRAAPWPVAGCLPKHSGQNLDPQASRGPIWPHQSGEGRAGRVQLVRMGGLLQS